MQMLCAGLFPPPGPGEPCNATCQKWERLRNGFCVRGALRRDVSLSASATDDRQSDQFQCCISSRIEEGSQLVEIVRIWGPQESVRHSL